MCVRFNDQYNIQNICIFNSYRYSILFHCQVPLRIFNFLQKQYSRKEHNSQYYMAKDLPLGSLLRYFNYQVPLICLPLERMCICITSREELSYCNWSKIKDCISLSKCIRVDIKSANFLDVKYIYL